MFKRIMILGVAALALAFIGPAVGGSHVAKAQTAPDQTAPDQGDAPDAPDQGDVPDQGDAPDAPDQGDGDDEGDAEDGACASSGARASGDSCPPRRQEQAQPAPDSRPSDRNEKNNSGGSGSGGQEVGSRSNEIVSHPTQVVQATTPVSAGVDTGTIPQGGIQAGAGGTADDGSNAGLLGGGALILVLAASGLALRRRNGLAS